MRNTAQKVQKEQKETTKSTPEKEVIVPDTPSSKKKSETILTRLGRATIKNKGTIIKIGLGTLLALWGLRQLNRSKEEVKKDSRIIREEKLPEYYPITPDTAHNDIRRESANLGSRVAEWALTGKYPSKSPEQIHKEAKKIEEEIGKKETSIRKKTANIGNRLGEWLKGGRQ